MTDTKRLNVADMDFDSIRDNLKEYLSSQDTLQDYDFEGSAITSIIDLLAYTTHFNAVNANVGLNETFLDTAQFRGSVVGHARMLGYTPRSARAPVAVLDIVLPDAEEGPVVQIPRGHRFKTKINNTSYTFVTTETYSSTNGIFNGVRIAQARFKTAEYVYDSRSTEKYLIPDKNVDTSTVRVEVFDSANSSTLTIYVPARTLVELNRDSNVYFLYENPDGFYELIFSDGVIGAALEDGNIINIEYGVTERAVANGARIFTIVDPIEDFSNVNVTTAQVARGGGERESIDSIKRNAPITFAAQNRGVTPKDYEAIIRENFANVRSVKVWGGEDNDPPVYGKSFISVLPRETSILSLDEKTQLLNDILIPKSVLAVTPEIVDPDFLFLNVNVDFKYNPSNTNFTKAQLESLIRDRIVEYNNNEIEEFGTVFRYSNFLSVIDETDPSILNSFAQVFLEKRFTPTVRVSRQYVINFPVPLYVLPSTDSVIKGSSTFTIGNNTGCYFEDNLNVSSGERIVSIVRGQGSNKRTVIRNAGIVENNKITINNFAPSDFQGLSVQIEVYPDVFDIASTFNNILTIDRINVSGTVDSIVAGREFSGLNYTSPSRNPGSGGLVGNVVTSDQTAPSINVSTADSNNTTTSSTDESTTTDSNNGSSFLTY